MTELRGPLALDRLTVYCLDDPWWRMRIRRRWTSLGPMHAADGRLP